MAEVEAVLVDKLLATVAVTTLISDRIDPLQRPQDKGVPYLTYQRTDAAQEDALGCTADLFHPTIEFKAYGKTYASVRAVIRAVFTALERYQNLAATPDVQDCIPGAYSEDFDGLDTYWCARSFEVWHGPG